MVNKIVVLSLCCLVLAGCGDSKARKPLAESSLQDMTAVPGGTYQMGGDHVGGFYKTVTLKSFYISKYNVSWKKYDLYSRATDKKYLDPIGLKYHGKDRRPDHPVDNLTWYQADNYCRYLGKITGLPYDLPTAAQWEYVARNNGKPNWDFPTDNGQQELGKNFPSYQQSIKGSAGGTPIALPIGSIPCTPQGVCGLTGAVNEWMKDAKGRLRALRGASAQGSPEFANVYGQAMQLANEQWGGFRCVINSSKPMSELRKIAAKHLGG